MRITRICSLMIFIAAAYTFQACNSTKANQSDVLKFNLQKGKTYAYQMEVNMENEMNGQKMNSEMRFDYDMEVVDDKDTLKTINSTYRRVVMNMNMPNMSTSLDTDKPSTDTAADMKKNPMGFMADMFRAVVGKTFSMKVSPEGKVIEVTGLKEMEQAMMNSIKVDEELRPMIQQAFQSQFNENNLKQSFEQAFNIFPNKAIKEGDTWQKTMNMGGMMPVTTTTTYTVKKMADDHVVLDVSGVTEIQGQKMNMTGEMTMNRATGLVTEATLKQQMDGPFKSTTTTKITGREKK